MTTVYLTIGFPGSGKSTWSVNKAKGKDVIILNKDALRTMFKGVYVLEEEGLVKESVKAILELCFKRGKDVILDETNLSLKTRSAYVDLIRSIDKNAKIVYVWFADESKCLDRRMNDPRGMSRSKWQGVISQMKKYYTEPTSSEDYDQIDILDCDGNLVSTATNSKGL